MAKKKGSRLKPQYDGGRYARVTRALHSDEKYRSLEPLVPGGQSLWHVLLTTPHASVIPGLIVAREATLIDELNWNPDEFRDAFAELQEAGMALADWSAGVIWLPRAVRHDPPTSPNVISFWGKALLNHVPRTAFVYRALVHIRTELAEILVNPKPWLERFDQVFPRAVLEKANAKPAVATNPVSASPPVKPSVKPSIKPSSEPSGNPYAVSRKPFAVSHVPNNTFGVGPDAGASGADVGAGRDEHPRSKMAPQTDEEEFAEWAVLEVQRVVGAEIPFLDAAEVKALVTLPMRVAGRVRLRCSWADFVLEHSGHSGQEFPKDALRNFLKNFPPAQRGV